MTKTAVITGGAGGLGQAMADVLLGQGWQVAIIDQAGEALARARGVPYVCDLTDAEALGVVSEQIIADFPSIDLVIYCAGVTLIGDAANMSDRAHRHLFEVNYFAAVACAQAFQSALRRSGGTHLAISSVAGFAPLFHRCAYAASKHALEGFFKSLRSEERPFSVRVCIAAPSFVATNMGAPAPNAAGVTRPGAARDSKDLIAPAHAAKIILNGLSKNRNFIPVGRIAHLSYWLNRLSPTLYQRLMERQISGA